MDLDRRTFLKVAGATSATSLLCAGTARASVGGALRAVLVDTTKCVGCRGCEAACAEANGLPEPVGPGDEAVFSRARATEPQVFTVVNRAAVRGADGQPRFAKSQCLHCVQPACASACPVRALEKQADGAVVYHRERCIGCRYCMVACPFGVPKYEYDKAIPYVRKCGFCAERQAKGLSPACVSACPSGALQLGTREALLEEARTRIYQNPDKYVHHVYGETEAGGTSWMYLAEAGVGFDELGLPQGVEPRPYPELTRTALAGVPVVMTLWPPLLMALYSAARSRKAAVAAEEESDRA